MPRKGNMPVPPKWSGQDKRFGETVKNNLDVLCGYSGNPLDRAITARDLLDSGIVKLAAGYNLFSGSSSGLAPVTDIATYDVPPAPTTLTVNGAFQNMLLSWNLESYAGHSHTEVFRHTLDVIADATLVGQTSGLSGKFTDSVGGGQTYYYWVRAINQNGVAGPFNSSTGTIGQTATDVSVLLDALTGAITDSELATDLQTEIDKISGNINVTDSVTARIAAEATARGEAITAEAGARATAVSEEASARATAISNSADVLQAQLNDLTGIAAWDSTESYSIDDKVRHDDKLWSADVANSDSEPTYSNGASTNSDWELTGDYTSLASVTAGNSASITAINNVSSDSTSAAAVAIKGLQTTVADPTTGLSATAGALTVLSNAVNHTDTGLVATAGNLTSLETAVFNDITGVSNWVGTDSSATPPTTAVSYAVGDRVVKNKKIYRAIDASTNIAPPNSSYWALDTVAAASAVTALSNTLTSDYATADATEIIEAAMLNSLTGVSDWNGDDEYEIGDRVIYEKRLYRAVAASENVTPPTDTDKWVTDSVTTASALTASEATAAVTYATTTNLTSLESATFGNLTGLSAYDEDTSYAVGDRVTHGTGDEKKIYIAIQASSASNKQAPTVTAYWDEDTLASLAVTNAALGGKETSGAAAEALEEAKTYADENSASASEFSLLNAAVFEDIAGVNAWANTSFYAIGDRIYHNQRIYKALKATVDILTGLSSWSSSTTYAVDAIVKYTNGGVTLPYKCLVSNSNATPHNNISGNEPKWAVDTPVPVIGGNTYWVIDAASLASALSLLTTDVEDNYARATDVTALDASVFGGASGAPAWSGSTAYVEGARVTHANILYKATAASSNQEPPNSAYWATARFATGSALTELTVEVEGKAETTSLTELESSIFNNVIGAPDWATGTNYSAGDTVTYEQKIYRALAASTNVEPDTNATKWVQDTLTTADQVEAAYAKSSDVTVLQSNLFDNMVDVDEWSNSANYSVGDRVVHTTSTGVKKLYKALIANSGKLPPNYISGATPKWALDTLASALAVDSLTTLVNVDESITEYVGGQFTDKVGDLGNLTVAQKFNSYRTASDQDTATTEEVDAAYAAIFTETTGLPDWDTTTTYAVGARVVHRENAESPRKVYKALIQSTNVTPHDNITGSNPKWEVDTLAFAGALSTLDATVNANGTGLVDKTDAIELRINNVGNVTMEQKFTAQATDIGDLESQYTVKIDSNGHVAGFGLANTTTASGTNTSEFYVNADRFAITPNLTSAAPDFAVGNSYSTGDYVTYSSKLWRFILLSNGQPVSGYTVNHVNLGPGGSSGMAPYLWEEAGETPFSVVAGGTVDGVYIPTGVYMDTAFIRNATITAAQIGSVNADTISAGYLNVTGLIEANAIEASKLLLDSTSLEETTLSDGTKALSVKAISASKIEAGTLDASLVTIDNLYANNITGDINDLEQFELASAVQIGGGDTQIWAGQFAATPTGGKDKKPYITAVGYGLWENDVVYKMKVQMKPNVTAAVTTVGTVASVFQFSIFGNVSYQVRFSGDVQSTVFTGGALKIGSTQKGIVTNTTYDTSNNLTYVWYTPTPYANRFTSSDVGSTVTITIASSWQTVSEILFRADYDDHPEPFALSGGLPSAYSVSVDVRIMADTYYKNQGSLPSVPHGTNWSGDQVLGLNGLKMSLR